MIITSASRPIGMEVLRISLELFIQQVVGKIYNYIIL